MSQALNHARHNKQACDLFHSNGNFPDWVITTAFYCAMHYAYAIIFPFEENGVTYQNIESYADANKHLHTKHGTTVHLVTVKHFAIAAHYKLLKDAAHTARYHDFNHPKEVVAKIRKTLDKVIDYAEKKYLELNPPTAMV
ncbi:MAG TPA: hypothetical protein VK483_14210 [Chitinophagaceae bacterium]|nr:hypothetical protein [Chitinophagaceae bacterium]